MQNSNKLPLQYRSLSIVDLDLDTYFYKDKTRLDKDNLQAHKVALFHKQNNTEQSNLHSLCTLKHLKKDIIKSMI